MRVQRESSSEEQVLEAIRARGTQGFTAAAIAAEARLCRQTVYKVIHKLNSEGHRIEGSPRLGFMAQLKPSARVTFVTSLN